MSTFSVTFGRYNLPHLGHKKLFQAVASGSKNHIIGVSKSETANAPLNLRMSALEALAPGYNFTPTTNLFTLVDRLVKEGHSVNVYLGSDQVKMGQAILAKYGPEVVSLTTLSREDGYSSTSIRQLLRSGQFSEAQKATGNVPLTLTRILHKLEK